MQRSPEEAGETVMTKHEACTFNRWRRVRAAASNTLFVALSSAAVLLPDMSGEAEAQPLSARVSSSAPNVPLVFEKAIPIPNVPVWPYSDVIAIDRARGRVFATPQAAKAVAIADLATGRILKMVSGIGKPHGLYYSAALNRLFVADGGAGDLKVFNGADYSLIKSIPLAGDSDAVTYDPQTNLVYVTNGGEGAQMDHAFVSAIDPVRMGKVADIPIASAELEAIALNSEKQLLYVSLKADAAIAVIDLRQRKVTQTWKLPPGDHSPFALALDLGRGRLYVTCRDDRLGMGARGTLFVLDTSTGRSVAQLPIGAWADGVSIDRKRQRVYISTGIGRVETYALGDSDQYRALADVDAPLLAKHSFYSEDLDRLFVDAPALVPNPARIVIYKPFP